MSSSSSLTDLFTARLSAVGGNVVRAFDSTAAAEAVVEIARAQGTDTLWMSEDMRKRASDLVAVIQRHGIDTRIPQLPSDARDQPLGLAIAEAAIAETGSSILSEPRVESRSVTLTTETLIVICPMSALLSSLDEAGGVLRSISANGASYATFVTGPSRTADIERQLTVGVQGPGEFHVILVDRLS